jgi:hypothetical protein
VKKPRWQPDMGEGGAKFDCEIVHIGPLSVRVWRQEDGWYWSAHERCIRGEAKKPRATRADARRDGLHRAWSVASELAQHIRTLVTAEETP